MVSLELFREKQGSSPDLWVALGLILLMEKLKYPGKLAEAF